MKTRKINVLLVPDSIHWVTGTMAQEIANKVEGINPIICSAPLLNQLLAECGGSFPLPLDVVHFLTPHIATQLYPRFSQAAACIATINHIENSLSVEPVNYIDGIMLMCQQWYDELIKEGVKEERLTIVNYGIDTQIFCPPNQEESQQLRRQYNIPEDAFVVGFSAKKSSDSCNRKGINILENLIRESILKYPSVWWVIRGPGWQPLVDEQAQLGAKITYLPFLFEKEEVAKSYRLMDAYIVTSRIEGGPVPLFEAMSSGVSCISTKVGLAPEIIKYGENGFLVDFDDIDTFSQLICQLEKNKNIRNRLGISARKSVIDNLQWEKTLTKVPHLYQKAIAAFQKRSPNLRQINTKDYDTKWQETYVKNWIKKRELLIFINLLKSEGEFKTARNLADTQLRKNWFDPEISNLYSQYSKYSKVSKLLSFPRRLIGKIKKIF